MKSKSSPFLSKTKYLEGLKCPKLLWYEYNRKEELPPVDARAQAVMDQGTIVGELAQTLFPGGIKLERAYEPEKQAEQSLKAARLRKPLFEAGFINERAYALADILNPVGKNVWDLIEVKSSTSAKDEYLQDVAFQKYVYEGAGLKIRRCYLMHINKEYTRHGKINPKQLFAKEDVTDFVTDIIPHIEDGIDSMIKAIAEKNPPLVKVSPHCDKPRTCPLEDKCWDFLPEKDDIFCLYGGTKKAYVFMQNGVLSITQIKESVNLTYKQIIQVESHASRKPYIDKKAIKEFLDTLVYPLYFLDFETMSMAIPPYDACRPYENIPFQYSLYVINKKGAKPKRYPYLATGKKDPRPEILKNLKLLLGKSGSIIAYNAIFEKTVLRKSSDAYPKYKKWLEGIEERVVDLLGPFRNFSYYHPDQSGSASLKDVMPVITNLTYENMAIADGGMASSEYCRVTFDGKIDKNERERVRVALEKYCDLDTKGMIDILRELEKHTR
ncbi:MAG: DUF2779 domain-containing protein [Candidatus Omnitrophota bacterium]